MYPDLEYLANMEDHTGAGVRVKSELTHRAAHSASPQADYRGLLLTEYVAPTEPMQIPSNSMPPGEAWQDSLKNGQNMFTDEPIDGESVKGIFGWETVDDTSIPYILRQQKKFVSVRIVERKLLSKYPNTFPDELGKKDPLVSYFITEAEACLLNEINTAHCDFEYGHNPFTVKDLIVDLEEFEEFFKVVKKTFPADVLAKIGEEPAPPSISSPVMSPPVKTDLSKFCGWIQINNTVSPYIIRFVNGKQVKLLPLSVIVYAAGLLTNSGVDGLLPTPQECAMLNETCKAAGFEFLFGKSTRLISISEVLQRCQVQLFELPFKNPLQHARYLDPRTGQSSSTSLLAGVGPHPQGTTPPAQHHPHPQMRSLQGSLNLMTGSPTNLNSYPTWFPPTSFHQSQVTMSGTLSAIPAGLNSLPGGLSRNQNGPSGYQDPSSVYHLSPRSGMEPSHLTNTRFQTMTEKGTDNFGPAQHGLPGTLWSHMPRGPPPSHANNSINSAAVSEASPVAPEPSRLPAYQPHSLPPSPLLHSINSPTMPDMNNTIFRSPVGMPPRSVINQTMHKDHTSGIARYAHPSAGPPPPHPPPQYSISQSYPYRGNQFDNSLFTRTKPNEQRHLGDVSIMSQMPNSRHSTGGESQKHASTHSVHNMHQNSSKTGPGSDPNPHTSDQNPASCNNNHPKSSFAHKISACLVNGKSISCITVDLPQRKGRFCLVEAVSKLYFPTVPLTEFVKVLQVVLKVNLHECTSEEEAAFVQYYSLPVNKLKCNKIIKVDDLEMYFPQLNYIFTKCAEEKSAPHFLSHPHSAVQKRKSSSSPSGPSMKTGHSKKDHLTHILGYERDTHQKGDSAANTGNGAAIIVIDDE